MRLYPFCLATAVALLAGVAASSRPTSEGPITSDQHEPQRFLRDGAEAHQEERGIICPSGIDEAIEFIKKWVLRLSLKLLTLVANQASAEDAFASLKLTHGTNLLSTPQFKEWATYAKWRAKDDPDAAAVDMAAVLAEKYGELGLAKMLDSSRKVGDTKDIATQLLDAQLKSKNVAGRLFDDLFANVKLDDDLLSTPQFKEWATYVSLITKDDPDAAAVVMFEVLAPKYRQVELAMMLEAASTDDVTKDIAIRVQHELLKYWLLGEPFNDLELFNMLGLPTIGLERLFLSPAFNIFVKYTNLSIAYDKSTDFPVIKAIEHWYEDEPLEEILNTAKMNPSTEDIATELLIQLSELHPKEVKPLKLGDNDKGKGLVPAH